MSHSHHIIRHDDPAAEPAQSLAAAKMNLLNWAGECDVRNRISHRSLASIASTGMFAIIGGMVIARFVTSSRTITARSGWVKKAIATLIFRAVMARVQRLVQTPGLRGDRMYNGAGALSAHHTRSTDQS